MGLFRYGVMFSDLLGTPRSQQFWQSAHTVTSDMVSFHFFLLVAIVTCAEKCNAGFQIFNNIPFRLGLPESATSGLEKFEG